MQAAGFEEPKLGFERHVQDTTACDSGGAPWLPLEEKLIPLSDS